MKDRFCSPMNTPEGVADLRQKIHELEERLERFGRIEEALRASEERYRTVIDNVEIGIGLISPSMEVISLNNQMRKWFPSVDTSLNPLCFKVFNDPPGESVCAYCPVAKTLKDGKAHRVITSTPSGGRVRHFKIISSPLRNKKGEVVAVIEMVEDITRRQRSEDLLKRERKIFFSVLQKAPYGVMVIGITGEYLYVNEAFTSITGYSARDVSKGKEWFSKAYPDPEYRKVVMEAWRRDITTKGVVRVFSVRCKNGETKEIEFRPTRLDDDRHLVMLSDVTEKRKAEIALLQSRDELEFRVRERTDELLRMNGELEQENAMRKETEEALKEREARLAAIIGATDALMFVSREDFTIQFMNEKLIRRIGYDGTGKLCYRVFHNRDSKCPWCVGEPVFSGETVRWERQSFTDNRWWYVINTPVYHPDGSISKQSMIIDITERKKAEEEISRLNLELEENVVQLKAVNAELETFSYSVSHDLKTPVIAVEGMSHILLEKYGRQLEGKARKMVTMINSSALEMRKLIEGLLAFYMLGRKKLKLSAVDLGSMVHEVFAELKEAHRGQVMQLSVETTPPANVDKIMVRQVVLNLLGNALKYSRTRAVTNVEFGGWAETGRLVFYVRDNGVGFSMDQRGRLFEVFERLHPAEQFEGAGIGLATVKRIVERHGGKVWAEGQVDQGATFYFSIPFTPADPR